MRSSYHYLFKNIAYVRCIWNFDQSCIYLLVYLCICIFVYLCICVFAHQILMNIFLRSSYHNLFKNIAYVMPMFNFNQSCICIFVYLHVTHSGILFLRSSYHNLFKNIAHVVPMFNFNQSCICVFVYLCICIWVTREWWWVSW